MLGLQRGSVQVVALQAGWHDRFEQEWRSDQRSLIWRSMLYGIGDLPDRTKGVLHSCGVSVQVKG